MASSNSNEADDLTTCAVCFERYNNEDHLPKHLFCLHTFCISCLSKMLVDSYTMTICCPACRAVTSPGNTLTSLRTNEHALRVLELEETIKTLNNEHHRQYAWCHSCDELARPECSQRFHGVTLLYGKHADRAISTKQLQKIQLRTSYALLRRREVDTYLKHIRQSLSLIDCHVNQLIEENATQIHLLEAMNEDLGEISSTSSASEIFASNTSKKSLEIAANAAYSSAIMFARTYEGAKDLLVSVNVERVNGKMGLFPPGSYQIQLCLTNPVEDRAVAAAGLNALSFILLLQMQQQNFDLPPHSSFNNLQHYSTWDTSPNMNSEESVLRSFFPLLYSQQCCYLDVELNRESRGRLVFQLVPNATSDLRNAFLNIFLHRQVNHLNRTIVKAGVSLFVVFGSAIVNRSGTVTGSNRVEASLQENNQTIRDRGDVGIYLSSNNFSMPDIVVLLAPFSERNVKRAPLVARLIDGMEFCLFLSHLKLNERPLCRIVDCGIH